MTTITFDPADYADIEPNQPPWIRALAINDAMADRIQNGTDIHFTTEAPTQTWGAETMTALVGAITARGIHLTNVDTDTYDDLRSLLQGVTTEDVSGWFDQRTNELYVRPGMGTANTLHTLLHEYAHALTVPPLGLPEDASPVFEVIAEATAYELIRRIGHDWPQSVSYLVGQLLAMGTYTRLQRTVGFGLIANSVIHAVKIITAELLDAGVPLTAGPDDLPAVLGLPVAFRSAP